MIVAKCPLRISLAGGGSDLDAYRKEFGAGAVVSFSVNLYTYVSVFRDLFGQNSANHTYRISYSKNESVQRAADIKNDIARVCANHFDSAPFSGWFTSDIPSHGSGLASSSAYMLSMIRALSDLENLEIDKMKVAELSWQLERVFNQHTGFQDPYGCALGGVNFIEKVGDNPVSSQRLNSRILENFKMFLLPTNVNRSSTNVLSSSSEWKFEKRLLDSAREMKDTFEKENKEKFVEIFTEVWNMKKRMSPEILNSQELFDLDLNLQNCSKILCHRLIGAGGGGYFFLITDKSTNQEDLSKTIGSPIRQIDLDNNGVRSTRIE